MNELERLATAARVACARLKEAGDTLYKADHSGFNANAEYNKAKAALLKADVVCGKAHITFTLAERDVAIANTAYQEALVRQ
jgi:hypothetical protein